MIDWLVWLMLQGNVSNEYGRIGVRVSSSGGVSKVYEHSPAKDAGIRRGDVILEADGVKGTKHIDGLAGTSAKLKVKRGSFIFEVEVPRVPRSAVFDSRPNMEFVETDIA